MGIMYAPKGASIEVSTGHVWYRFVGPFMAWRGIRPQRIGYMPDYDDYSRRPWWHRVIRALMLDRWRAFRLTRAECYIYDAPDLYSTDGLGFESDPPLPEFPQEKHQP